MHGHKRARVRAYTHTHTHTHTYSTVSVIFPLTSLLSSLYWPWDPLSSLESTPVSIQVPKQVDCNMCRFSKLLLFSFFFCKDGSDRLMKRASYSCCNFLCIVLAAAYLKYRLCRLSCLPFVWHPFFHCDTMFRTFFERFVHLHAVEAFHGEFCFCDSSAFYSCSQNILVCWNVVASSDTVEVIQKTASVEKKKELSDLVLVILEYMYACILACVQVHAKVWVQVLQI